MGRIFLDKKNDDFIGHMVARRSFERGPRAHATHGPTLRNRSRYQDRKCPLRCCTRDALHSCPPPRVRCTLPSLVGGKPLPSIPFFVSTSSRRHRENKMRLIRDAIPRTSRAAPSARCPSECNRGAHGRTLPLAVILNRFDADLRVLALAPAFFGSFFALPAVVMGAARTAATFGKPERTGTRTAATARRKPRPPTRPIRAGAARAAADITEVAMVLVRRVYRPPGNPTAR